jgi:hypothetical protein
LILPFYVLAYILPLQKPKLDTYHKIINIFPLNAIHEGEYSCVDIFEQTMSFLLLSTHSLRQIVMLVRTPVPTLLSHQYTCGFVVLPSGGSCNLVVLPSGGSSAPISTSSFTIGGEAATGAGCSTTFGSSSLSSWQQIGSCLGLQHRKNPPMK